MLLTSTIRSTRIQRETKRGNACLDRLVPLVEKYKITNKEGRRDAKSSLRITAKYFRYFSLHDLTFAYALILKNPNDIFILTKIIRTKKKKNKTNKHENIESISIKLTTAVSVAFESINF